ncbi:MAG: hypothetical protein JWN00_3178 [Actinomycetia bacterium]|nr:hypothetical protein [Actinomycetes bacterium]
MRDEEIASYAQQVRESLAGIPAPDRDELVEDLEDHLAEVAAESGEPLTARLGTPAAYAAELRAAYGAESGKGGRSVRTAARDAAGGLERSRAWALLRELRPVWWVVRAWLASMFLWYFTEGRVHTRPEGPLDWAVLLVLLVASAQIGVQTRDGGLKGALRLGLGAVNVISVFGALIYFALYATFGFSDNVTYAQPPPDAVSLPTTSQGDVTNLIPYSADGKPLSGILLYDQNGHPFQLPYEQFGFELARPCGGPAPITNSYPLPLRSTDSTPSPQPSCPPGIPSAVPTH